MRRTEMVNGWCYEVREGISPSMIAERARVPRVLVIEDVQETRDAIAELLENNGYCVDRALDAGDAVKIARSVRPDLILISAEGSTERRISTARTMRERAQLTEATPVVIFAIVTISEGSEQRLPDNIHLSRPDNFNQLRALLARILKPASRPH